MYLVDPSGDAVQCDAEWGDNAPSFVADAADDALQNLCTQGNCSSIHTVTTPSCAAALAEACAGLAYDADDPTKINACADCAHWRWDDLSAAGCYHQDTVKYCVGQ